MGTGMKTERETHSHEYQTLLDYIPSGIQQCLNDAYLLSCFDITEYKQI